MSSIRTKFLLSATICCSTSALSEDNLSTITISASRTPTQLQDTPSAITIINKQDILKSNTTFVYELLQSVPGLNVSTQGSRGSLTQVRIRGSEANQVLVIIDGIEVNDPATSSAFDFAHLPTQNIEKIEILRGPQSALWGSDALAGVINITTSKISPDKHVVASSSYGSENTYQGNLQFNSGTDAFNFSTSANFIDTDGINSSTSGNERDGYDNTTLNLNTSYQMNNVLNLGLSTRYTNASNEFDPAPVGVPMDGFGKNDVEQFYLRGFIELATLNDQWVHVFEGSLVDTNNDSVDEIFGSSQSAASKEKFAYQSTLYMSTFADLGLNQTLTFAVEREQERFTQKGAAFPGFNPNQKQKITNYGKVIEYRANLYEQWTLSAAFRHDNNDEFDNQGTYRIGLNYLHPTTQTKLYAAHATGAKNPSFTELFGFAPNNFIGNTELEAETSEAWELGISQILLNDRINLNAAIFWEDLKDEIQTIFLPTFQSTVINNQTRSERRGLELSVSSRITKSLNFNGAFTYLDASEPDTTGNDRSEIRRPKQQWSGQMNYSFLDNKANVNVNIDYIGDRRDINFSNGERVTLDDYTRVDLALNYQYNQQIKLFAAINNLFDEEYQDVFGFETYEFSGFIGLEVKL